MEHSIVASLSGASLLPYGLQDLEQLRLLLRGDSVIDWQRLAFRDHQHVDKFLKLVGFDTREPMDLLRLEYLHRRALKYAEGLNLEISSAARAPEDFRDLFLMAGRAGSAQRGSCILLKIMNVIHHVSGRELLYRLPVSSNQLFYIVESKVFEAIDAMKSAGVQILEFSGSRKSHESIVTKLLSRPDSLTADIHDRLRFRVVTESLEDLFNALIFLTRELLPFNYAVPGESRNDLIDLERSLKDDPRLRRFQDLLQRLPGVEERSRMNRFSAAAFRVINFIVDMPVRVDEFLKKLPNYSAKDGAVVFVLVEFQFMDRATRQANDSGEVQHTLYKERQRQRVRVRLMGD